MGPHAPRLREESGRMNVCSTQGTLTFFRVFTDMGQARFPANVVDQG
jgi:hypothetical protein